MAAPATYRVLDTRIGTSIENAGRFDFLAHHKSDLSTEDVIGRLADAAAAVPIGRLIMICHSGHSAEGDWWIKLGKDGIGAWNLRKLRPLAGRFGGPDPSIELRACWIVTNPGGSPTDALPAPRSGAALCHGIADLLDVTVYGSDTAQPGPCGLFWLGSMSNDGLMEDWNDAGSMARRDLAMRGECSEGAWAGKVYRFRPGKPGAEIVTRPR
ncbi:hypothetical protein [Roseomonas fluvialis]|uniref:DUF4347 domain-containing protein n=1 Tax=Roseomonas fluvialis TaxID=1750527 RepID=A0ABN6P624_9PROT|nr:hypothetical protein [Roseomonas fluvialis]BDG74129.1 hypothetical protein Rmf_40580 [Roseomonas fluvialis]